MLVNLLLIIGVAWIPSIQGQCLEYDSKPPKCHEWVDIIHGNQSVFIEHQFNCSRFWVCQPDLSDCLHECAPADNEGHALYFDVRYQYPYGPVCDWPSNINCDNKPDDCGKCEVWQECVQDGNGGWICIPDCKIHEHCQNDEYCDYPDANNDGHCHKGCRDNGDPCGRCGSCNDHKCREPQCCTNADCPANHHCINGDCVPECATDSDCTGTSCSSCINHECFDPECCTDADCKASEYCSDANTCEPGCNEDSDCKGTKCSKCDMNTHQCVDPECCKNEDCPKHDGLCDSRHTTCDYCDDNECKPGCVEDSNCPSGHCTNHKCLNIGSHVINMIEFKTKDCNGCTNSPVETGLQMNITGENERDTCLTDNLDHPDRIDYSKGATVTFNRDDDDKPFGGCSGTDIGNHVSNGTVTWNGQGSWTIDGQVTFNFTRSNNPLSLCSLENPTLSPSNKQTKLVDCVKVWP